MNVEYDYTAIEWAIPSIKPPRDEPLFNDEVLATIGKEFAISEERVTAQVNLRAVDLKEIECTITVGGGSE